MRELSTIEQQLLIKHMHIQRSLTKEVTFAISEMSDEWQQEWLEKLQRIIDILDT